MKAKIYNLLLLLVAQVFINNAHAVTPINRPDATAAPYVFVENNMDDNYFITPGAADAIRMTGSNRWSGLKYTGGAGAKYQVSLGYMNNSTDTPIPAGMQFDMWFDHSPIPQPLLGLRCINWYVGCDMNTSLILPQHLDSDGFYGATVTPGGTKWVHGLLSDSFYDFVQKKSVGSSFNLTINTCYTKDPYNAANGGRCKDQKTGTWAIKNITYTKGAHLHLINTNSLADVYINSDGVPTLGEGNHDCKMAVLKNISGISCKMVNYTLRTTGLSNTTIRLFPAINKSSLETALKQEDLQFSLNGDVWKSVSKETNFFTFNEMKASDSIYMFFSTNFFKQLIALNISDVNTTDLFSFRLKNTLRTESGYYEFSTSNSLNIKPRDFSISIISDEQIAKPSREGYVGPDKPSLDFGYIVTTSGRTAADRVDIKVIGPTQVINGRSYCLFSSVDGSEKVPFPAQLTFLTESGGTKTYDAGCDGTWHNMTNALWVTTPWSDSSGYIGEMNKATVHFSIAMNDPISLHTLTNNSWFGEVSASGEIHVKAKWRDIN